MSALTPTPRFLLAAILAGACATAPPSPPEPPAQPEPAPVVAAPLPAPLPPPEPPPEPEPPVRVEPADPLDIVWNHRLSFAAGGSPLVTIRIVEGQAEIAVTPRGKARLRLRGGAELEVAAGATLRLRARDALPSALARFPLLAELDPKDKPGVEAARALWEKRGVATRARTVGGVYGIAGKVIDNRRALLLADGDGSEGWARGFAEGAAASGARPAIFTEQITRPQGKIEVRTDAGALLGVADALVALDVEGD